MTIDDINVGRVVLSKAGRDRGRHFIVLEKVNEDYVKIADGALRKIERPKIKKIKHLKAKEELISTLQEKIIGGKKIFDSEIRSNLEALGYNIEIPEKKEE